MKLIYLTHWRVPSEKTMSPLITKTCNGFVDNGYTVELWLPRRSYQVRKGATFEEFGLEKKFKVRYIPVIDIMRFSGGIGFILMVMSYIVSAYVALLSQKKNETVIYGHDIRDFYLPIFSGIPSYIEIHDFFASRFSFFDAMVLKRAHGLVVTNTIKIKYLNKRFKFPIDRMIHMPNAVDVHKFEIDMPRRAARETLLLPRDRKIALYTGHLFGWKGVHTLAEAVKFLPPLVWVYFVGGTEQDRIALKDYVIANRLPRIEFLPHQPHDKIPLFQKAADVLVLPNTAKDYASKYETSPVKLFEYLASGMPTVASDIPSIRDVVSDREVVFFEPDEPESLAHAIEYAISENEDVRMRAHAAQSLARTFTWENRSNRLSEFVRKYREIATN